MIPVAAIFDPEPNEQTIAGHLQVGHTGLWTTETAVRPNDFLELHEYPLPPGFVHAVPCHPWLTCHPPQDTKFDISFNDILRPYHTYKGDVLPMSGLYFLKRFTRKLGGKQGKTATEKSRLFDEVINKCAYPTRTRWMVVSIAGAPFEDGRKRCTPIAPTF